MENLSSSDLVLRLAYENGEVGIYKQTLTDLMTIFCEYGNDSIDEDTLRDLLDAELTPVSAFYARVNKILERLEQAKNGINTIIDLAKSIRPRTYVGRIIISTTDDTEKKVISKYGGTRWRRVVNFLRGVDGDSELGKKHGEEYVCLRTSSIPNHSHSMKNLIEGGEDTTEKVLSPGSGSDSKLLNMQVEGISGYATRQVEINYQISPLECQSNSDVTYPHNNMPPYKDVYIWECMAINKDEYAIRYNMNGIGEVPENAKTSYTPNDLSYSPPIPINPSRWVEFIQWYPDSIPVGTIGDFTFNAIWKFNDINVHFDDNLVDVKFDDNTIDVHFDDNESA